MVCTLQSNFGPRRDDKNKGSGASPGQFLMIYSFMSETTNQSYIHNQIV